MSDHKTKLLAFVPNLRHAFAEARREGEPKLGVLAVDPSGGGRVIARFDGAEFLASLCAVLGVPVENTNEEEMNAAADAIISMFGPVHRAENQEPPRE